MCLRMASRPSKGNSCGLSYSVQSESLSKARKPTSTYSYCYSSHLWLVTMCWWKDWKTPTAADRSFCSDASWSSLMWCRLNCPWNCQWLSTTLSYSLSEKPYSALNRSEYHLQERLMCAASIKQALWRRMIWWSRALLDLISLHLMKK